MVTKSKLNKISAAILEVNRGTLSKSTIAATAIAAFLAGPVYAEEAKKNKVAEEVEVIEVKGMRGTMTRSLNIKKNTAAVTDGIAAADFGDLPGLSISDVIENITSVTGHRGKGSASEMSIRGLGPFLSNASFNGRSITSGGFSRAVNFKKFPSELVDKVTVYKSQQANLIAGGVAGTINVDSLRALDFGEEQSTVELTGIYNSHSARIDGDDGFGNKITASIIRQYETDNLGDIGFTLGLQRTDSANPEESMLTSSTMYACGTRLADGTPLSTGTSDCEDTDQSVARDTLDQFAPGSVFLTPSSWTFRNQEEEDFREAVVATVQWQPNDEWDINLDVEFSDNHYSENRHDLIFTSARDTLRNHVIDDNMNLLYREGEAKMEAQGLYRAEDERYNGFGLEIAHALTDDLSLSGDISYSKTHRNRTGWKSRIVTGDTWNYSLDNRTHRLSEVNFLTDDVNGGDDNGVFDPTNPNSWSAEYNNGKAPEGKYEREMDYRTNRVWAGKIDLEYTLDNDVISSIQAGVRYSSEELYSDLDDDVAIDPNTGAEKSEYKTKDETETGLLIENCFDEWNNSDWFDSEDGPGLVVGEYAQFDGRCGYGSLSQANEDRSFVDQGPWKDRRSTGDVDVEENVLSLYGMVNIDTELFGLPVTGNVGVRVVKTDIESHGYLSEYEIVETTDNSGSEPVIKYNLEAVKDADGNTVLTEQWQENDTTNVLPSANITFHYSDTFLIRTAAYKAMSRPQLLSMSAGRKIDVNEDDDITDPNDLIREVTGGNPYMEPLMSNNIDLSFEWYPSMDTAVSLALYGKQFEANFRSVTLEETMIIDGQPIEVPLSTGTYTDDEAYLRGFEISAQHHFSELPAPFNGIGMKGSYNYANSSFENEDGTFGDVYDEDGVLTQEGFPNIGPANVFGFSKNVFSGSIYWEGDNLSFRVLYKSRSKYFQPNSGAKANRYVEPFEYVDFNAKYKITKNTSVSLKALNILDEAQYMTRGVDKTPTLISSSGPKYFLSLKHKF